MGAFMLVMIAGLLKFTAHASELLDNRVFTLKMELISVYGLNAVLLHTVAMSKVSAWDVNAMPPLRVRIAALFRCTQMVLWPRK